MLASRLPGLLPPLSNQEALESAAIQSLVNLHTAKTRWRQRTVPRPHHSASLAAMVGGGSIPVPGEISLAHNGVLFLDELPEFERRVLDALREPIESGKIHISRSRAKINYPARFQLIAAMNQARQDIIRVNIIVHRRSRHCATLDACQALPRPLRSFARDPIAAARNTESGLAGRRIERNGPAAGAGGA